jgi:hypothetical protein
LFNYIDYVSLDDGEATIRISVLEHLEGQRSAAQELKRSVLCAKRQQSRFTATEQSRTGCGTTQKDVGTPDYSDLLLEEYISVIEVANPMHRLVERWAMEQTHPGAWLLLGEMFVSATFRWTTLSATNRSRPLMVCDRMETDHCADQSEPVFIL